jgi:hypothetical protein
MNEEQLSGSEVSEIKSSDVIMCPSILMFNFVSYEVNYYIEPSNQEVSSQNSANFER